MIDCAWNANMEIPLFKISPDNHWHKNSVKIFTAQKIQQRKKINQYSPLQKKNYTFIFRPPKNFRGAARNYHKTINTAR